MGSVQQLTPLAQHLYLNSFLNLTEKLSQITMPKGSGLTKPMKLSAELADIVGKKEASRAECIKQLWAYLKRTTSKIPKTSNSSSPTRRWPRSSATTKSVPSEWPSSSPPICLKLLYIFITYPKLNADHQYFNRRRHFFEKKMCVLIKMNAITDYYLLNYMYSKIKSILYF